MKVMFTRKAVDVMELIRRPYTERDASNFIIEKTVELPSSEFLAFTRSLLKDYSFIEENIDLMYRDTKGLYHCILVKEKGSASGILVESEGYSYARYAAIYEE